MSAGPPASTDGTACALASDARPLPVLSAARLTDTDVVGHSRVISYSCAGRTQARGQGTRSHLEREGVARIFKACHDTDRRSAPPTRGSRNAAGEVRLMVRLTGQ